MNLVRISGAGGKSGGSVRSPLEAENTLQARSYVRVVDALCEGPIAGFVNSNGVLCIDCVLSDSGQPILDGDGAMTYPDEFFEKTVDGIIIGRKRSGGSYEPIFNLNSSGYPLPLTLPLETPKILCLITKDTTGSGAEIEVVVHASATAAEGRVWGIKLNSGGSGYTTPVVSIPPSIGQAIRLDDITLQRTDDLSFQFSNVRLAYRLGTESQDPMEGFEQVEEVVDGSAFYPVLYRGYTDHGLPGHQVSLTNKNFDRALVDIDLREGFFLADQIKGDTLAAVGENALRIRITQQYKADDGEFGTERDFGDGIYTISGKTTSGYVKSIEGRLLKSATATVHSWVIRIYRLSYDDDSTTFNDDYIRHTKFGIARITGVTDVKMQYPFCALVGLEVDAQQFSRIPTRAYDVKMLLVQVPSNYFPPGSRRPNGTIRSIAEYNRRMSDDGVEEAVFDSSGYAITQDWDGTFYQSWTNNPAWIFYAVVSNSRYGLGDLLPAANKWTLYSIGRYCDEVVYTGYLNGSFRGPEPRFSCNFYIQGESPAWGFLTDVASVFRAMIFWANGQIFAVQDSPKTPSYVFSSANVKDGNFIYSGTARKARHTVVVVNFNDPSDNYKLKPVIVEDDEGIRRLGRITKEVTAFGCTSRGQARRFGIWILKTEIYSTETVTFKCGNIGALLRVGGIISVLDKTKSQVDYAGRIVAMDADSQGRSLVTLDRAIPRDQFPEDIPNRHYRFFCSAPKPFKRSDEVASVADLNSLFASQITQDFQVTAFAHDAYGRTVVHLNGALPPEVVLGAVWGLRNEQLSPQYFKILGVDEVETFEYEVTGLEYHSSIFATVDADAPYSEDPITYDVDKWKRPGPPTDLVLDVTSKIDQEQLVYTLTASWTPPVPAYVKEYLVYLKKGLGNFQLITATSSTSIDFRLVEADSYTVRVYAVGITGIRSNYVEGSTIVGTIDGSNLEIVSGLELFQRGNDNTTNTSDFNFDWRINWSGANSTFHTEVPDPLPPGVSDYMIRVLSPEGESPLMERVVKDSAFSLTLEMNKSLPGGPYREFIFEVRVRTNDGAISAPTKIRVNNPTPTVPSLTVVADDQGNAVITILAPSSNADFGGYRVWMDDTTGFDPDETNLVFQGTSTEIRIAIPVGQVRYFRVAEFDSLSKTVLDCTISSEYSVTGYRSSSRESALLHIRSRRTV